MQMAINHYKKLSEQGSNQAYLVAKFLEENFLEVEEQQIIDAYRNGKINQLENSEIYYNETFKSEIKTVKCPNQHCDDGVVDIIFGEKQFCGICDGEGLIDDIKQETYK